MNIKNSREIVSEFIERYNFYSIFADSNLPEVKCAGVPRMNNSDAVEFLLASSLAGNKNAGFFRKLPRVRTRMPLRGECVLMVFGLPERIDVPTLFCREPENLGDMLSLCAKVSAESKLPCVLAVSDNARRNYADAGRSSADLARTSPYLHADMFKGQFDDDSFRQCVSCAESVVSSVLGAGVPSGYKISFSDPEYDFYDYLLPGRVPLNIAGGGRHTIYAPKNEAAALKNMLNDSYRLSLEIADLPDKAVPDAKKFLCPGCPLVNIFLRLKDKNVLAFTDMDCRAAAETFGISVLPFESYMGLISNGLNVRTVFVGSASSYRPHCDEFIKKGTVIFLDDCGVSDIRRFESIRYPKKINTDKNSIFPYGCSNIRRYSKIKINLKKCKCPDGEAECAKATLCPAIYVSDGLPCIDHDLCAGCLACKIACPHGAMS